MKRVPFGVVLMARTLPSFHFLSFQKSRKSPIFNYLLTLRAASFCSKLAVLYLQACTSDSSNYCSIRSSNTDFSSRDGLNYQQMSAFLHSGQVGLCLRDSSAQGRQKAWPHSVRVGQRRGSRQTGQPIFSIGRSSTTAAQQALQTPVVGRFEWVQKRDRMRVRS